jgi:hypothetical protein
VGIDAFARQRPGLVVRRSDRVERVAHDMDEFLLQRNLVSQDAQSIRMTHDFKCGGTGLAIANDSQTAVRALPLVRDGI